jgi:DNA-directed RNA polymerase specialized sigma subunit
MTRNEMQNQEELNDLVWKAQEGDKDATEELWDFYFPAVFQPIVLEGVAKYEIEDEMSDLFQDCYIIFRDVVKEYPFDSYNFSYHLRHTAEDRLTTLIQQKYFPRKGFGQ